MVMTPERFVGKMNTAYRNLVKAVDAKLIEAKNAEDWNGENEVTVIIGREFIPQLRDMVAAKYMDAGWPAVAHRTSSENKERPGLTSFTFYFDAPGVDSP